MESESLAPFYQLPATGSEPWPYHSSHNHVYFWRSVVMFSFHEGLVLNSVPFPSDFWLKFCIHILSITCMLQDPFIFTFLISLMKSVNLKHCFPSTAYFPLYRIRCWLAHYFIRHSRVCVCVCVCIALFPVYVFKVIDNDTSCYCCPLSVSQ